jgi:hypothetical protein
MLSAYLYVFLCCVDRNLAVGRSPFQGVLAKCLKRFIVSEINSEPEQAGGRNA